MRLGLKFAYNGRKFYGYARQPELRTVEGELIKVLIKHGFIEGTKESVFRSASRTDKGVSALCNAIAFNTPSSKSQILKAFSNEFPDIVVYGIAVVDSDFNPRFAKYRHYRYYLDDVGLDFDKVIAAAACFTGEHDFSNFARVEEFKDPVRNIENIMITEIDGFLVCDFYAQTFLWQQIRRIIAVLEKIGIGKLEKEKIVEALTKPDKGVDYGLALAEPLILMDIIYDFEFESDKILLRKACEIEQNLLKEI